MTAGNDLAALYQRLLDVLVLRVANGQLTEADAEAMVLRAEQLLWAATTSHHELAQLVADLEHGDGPWGVGE